MACLSGIAASICGGSGAGPKALPAPPAKSLPAAEPLHRAPAVVPQPGSFADAPKLADVLDVEDNWADGSQHPDEEAPHSQVHSPGNLASLPFYEGTSAAAAVHHHAAFPNGPAGAGQFQTPQYEISVSNSDPLDSSVREREDSTVSSPVPPKRPRDVAFFSGSWSGARNDWTGDVGINFVIETDCTITALGRHVYDSTLADGVTVRLWKSEATVPKDPVAERYVGPYSQIEGEYAFEALDPPIQAKAGEEYRLTLKCKAGMPHKWYDGRATAAEVAAYCAPGHVRFVGGVCRNSDGYPNREDGEFRRAGIVNFKIATEPVEILPVTRAELASKIAHSAALGACGDPEATDTTFSIVAGLLALLVDELAAVPGITASVVVAHDELVKQRLQLEPAETAADLSKELAGNVPGVQGTSVSGQRFARELVSFARQSCSSGTNGSPALDDPLEGAFVVSSRTGCVLAAAARVLRGPQPLAAAELVVTLGSGGMAFVRSADGAVAAFLAPEAQKCKAFVIKRDESR